MHRLAAAAGHFLKLFLSPPNFLQMFSFSRRRRRQLYCLTFESAEFSGKNNTSRRSADIYRHLDNNLLKSHWSATKSRA